MSHWHNVQLPLWNHQIKCARNDCKSIWFAPIHNMYLIHSPANNSLSIHYLCTMNSFDPDLDCLCTNNSYCLQTWHDVFFLCLIHSYKNIIFCITHIRISNSFVFSFQKDPVENVFITASWSTQQHNHFHNLHIYITSQWKLLIFHIFSAQK